MLRLLVVMVVFSAILGTYPAVVTVAFLIGEPTVVHVTECSRGPCYSSWRARDGRAGSGRIFGADSWHEGRQIPAVVSPLGVFARDGTYLPWFLGVPLLVALWTTFAVLTWRRAHLARMLLRGPAGPDTLVMRVTWSGKLRQRDGHLAAGERARLHDREVRDGHGRPLLTERITVRHPTGTRCMLVVTAHGGATIGGIRYDASLIPQQYLLCGPEADVVADAVLTSHLAATYVIRNRTGAAIGHLRGRTTVRVDAPRSELLSTLALVLAFEHRHVAHH